MADVKVRLPRELVEIEALLDESSKRVGRAVRNMKELAVSGLPTSTPGNGSPGGGKGGAGRTISVPDAMTHTIDRVPVTSVEAMVMEGEPDFAERAFVELGIVVRQAAVMASAVVEDFTGRAPVSPDLSSGLMRLVVYSFGCSGVLVHLDVPERWRPDGGWSRWERPVRRIWQLTQTWGFVPAEPKAGVQRELLATDLTGQWCRSCLRVGVRDPRDRTSEFCRWCRKFDQLEGFLPPVDLLQVRADGQRITEAMVEPHRHAHRERLKREERAKR